MCVWKCNNTELCSELRWGFNTEITRQHSKPRPNYWLTSSATDNTPCWHHWKWWMKLSWTEFELKVWYNHPHNPRPPPPPPPNMIFSVSWLHYLLLGLTASVCVYRRGVDTTGDLGRFYSASEAWATRRWLRSSEPGAQKILCSGCVTRLWTPGTFPAWTPRDYISSEYDSVCRRSLWNEK